jgi:alpha-glucoside transport system substrate-binding protein
MRAKRTFVRGAAATAALGLALGAAAACADDNGAGNGTGVITVIGTWGGDEEEAFRAMVAPFEEETGYTVEYTGTRDIATVLATGVAAGVTLPDLAGLPGPGQMREFAQRGALVPLNDVLDVDTYRAETAPALVDLGTVDGDIVGVFIKAAVKGLIWYNTDFYDGTEPATWDEVESTADSLATGDIAPWCVGLESGAASGWPGTDWIENFVLRQSGPDVYDAWLEGQHPWNSPEIREAFEAFGEVTGDRAFGGSNYVLNTNFGAAANPMFEDPPGCVFHQQASFITGFFSDEAGAGPDDYDFFMMPDIDPAHSGAVMGAGDLFGMFNDTPEARELMAYLVTPEAQQIWVDERGEISPNTTVTDYPDEITARSAQLLAEAEIFRFDASDLMPQAMNDAFWSAILDYVQNPDRLDSILADLDEVQETAYED